MNLRRGSFTLGRFALSGRTFVGEVRGDEVLETDALALIEFAERDVEPNGKVHRLSGLRVLAPVDRPSKIVCIGLNYRSHIEEMGWDTPSAPIIFSKPSSAVIGPGEDIVLPVMSKRVDYEGETAIVIGRRASRTASGAEHIFGYTAFNDVTARDLQEKDRDWTRAKGFDTFAPMGPFVTSRAPSYVTTRLNGETVQRGPTSDRVFDDAALVEYISEIMVLEPGDVIATGTPSGISPLGDGDTVEVEVDGAGVLRNAVVARKRREV